MPSDLEPFENTDHGQFNEEQSSPFSEIQQNLRFEKEKQIVLNLTQVLPALEVNNGVRPDPVPREPLKERRGEVVGRLEVIPEPHVPRLPEVFDRPRPSSIVTNQLETKAVREIEERSLANAKEVFKLESTATKEMVSEKIQQQILLLDDDDFAIRDSATKLLKRVGLTAVKDVAVALQKTDSPEVRRRANAILTHIASPKGIVEVLEHQEDLKRIESGKVIDFEKHFLSPESAEGDLQQYDSLKRKLLKMTETPSVSLEERVRVTAVRLNLKQAALEVRTNEPSSIERIQSVAELIAQHDTAIENIISDTRIFRLESARSMVRQEPQEALKLLLLVLKDKSADFREGEYEAAVAPVLLSIENIPGAKDSYERWLQEVKKAGISIETLQHKVALEKQRMLHFFEGPGIRPIPDIRPVPAPIPGPIRPKPGQGDR